MTLTIQKLDQLPSNIQVVDSNGFPTNAFVFYLLKMFKKALLDNQNMAALLAEIDAVELGAGLNPNGTYAPDVTAHYINSATSLFDADILIDIALHNVQIELNTTQSGAGLNTDGTYTADPLSHYISTATSLKNADSLMDAQLFSTQSELDTAESGAGLNSGGTYSADATTHYLTTATSLKDADKKLDTELYNHSQLSATHGGNSAAHGSNGNIVGFNDTATETLYGLVKRCALIADASMSTTAITTADIATAPVLYDQTYTNTMASLINENKSKVNSIVTDLGNVVTKINDILAKMKTANQMTT